MSIDISAKKIVSSNKIVVIGDLHGKIKECSLVLSRITDPVICVGDVGIGFRSNGNWITVESLGNFEFIHGNHDDPEMCAKEKGYLGRYGVTPEGIFFMSGAFSVDAFYRTSGVDWWFNEQLNIQELDEAIELYKKTKPDIVITHDCPRSLYPFMLNKIGKPQGPLYENATSHALETMRNFHQPKIHVFGHWHRSVDEQIGDTRFICLNELEPVTLEF